MKKTTNENATPSAPITLGESEKPDAFESIPCHGIVLELPHEDVLDCTAIAAAERKTVSDSIYDDVVDKLDCLDTARRLLTIIRCLEHKSTRDQADLEKLGAIRKSVLHLTARMFKDNL